ncbi:MAG TPA: SMP-30/gluconolactonase/LRE family protein [Kofleriaceae bacterium]|nr:SMP-30/gluconolactonase/LRE family protein [Kofleriaceae bacterium]
MKRAFAVVVCSVAASACGGDGGGQGDDDGVTIDADLTDVPMNDCGCVGDRPFEGNPLDGIGPVTMVGSGYVFTEGPQWRASGSEFVFSDIQGNQIYRWPMTGAPTSFRNPSGNSNGLAVDTNGTLLACEHGNRRVSRGDGATPATVVDRFEGSRFNSPNDLTVRSDGTIYFTDPPYGIQDNQRELAFMGVFRIAPGGAITAERRGALTERPNGIALSPDETRLYVGDSEADLVRVYDVAGGGALSNPRTFATPAGPDGMAVDAAGNLFVAAAQGVQVYSPTGTLWGEIDVPMQPANVAFGGTDARTLLITARTAVYRVSLVNPGLPTH